MALCQITLSETATPHQLKELARRLQEWCEDERLNSHGHVEVAQGLQNLRAGKLPPSGFQAYRRCMKDMHTCRRLLGDPQPAPGPEYWNEIQAAMGPAASQHEVIILLKNLTGTERNAAIGRLWALLPTDSIDRFVVNRGLGDTA